MTDRTNFLINDAVIGRVDGEYASHPGMLFEEGLLSNRVNLLGKKLDAALPMDSIFHGKVDFCLHKLYENNNPKWSCEFRGNLILPRGWIISNSAAHKILMQEIVAIFPFDLPQEDYAGDCDIGIAEARELVDRTKSSKSSRLSSDTDTLVAAFTYEEHRVELAACSWAQSSLSVGILAKGLRFDRT